MCCFFTSLVLIGPRFVILIWWIIRPVLFNAIFNTWIWPLLGLIFLPWTLLMYLFVSGGGVSVFEWFLLGVALLADIGSYAGGAFGNRDRLTGYKS